MQEWHHSHRNIKAENLNIRVKRADANWGLQINVVTDFLERRAHWSNHLNQMPQWAALITKWLTACLSGCRDYRGASPLRSPQRGGCISCPGLSEGQLWEQESIQTAIQSLTSWLMRGQQRSQHLDPTQQFKYAAPFYNTTAHSTHLQVKNNLFHTSMLYYDQHTHTTPNSDVQ